MRVLTTDALNALDSGRFASRNGFRVDMDAGAVGFWDDAYDITVSSVTYHGAAGGFTIGQLPSAADMAARSLDVTLNGLNGDIIAEILNQPYHQRPVSVLRFVIATDAPQVLMASTWFTGFIDTIQWRERPNGTSQLVVKCEDIGRENGRKGARTRSDADQRQIESGDLFFEHTVASINSDIEWGRAPPPPQPQRAKLFGIF